MYDFLSTKFFIGGFNKKKPKHKLVHNLGTPNEVGGGAIDISRASIEDTINGLTDFFLEFLDPNEQEVFRANFKVMRFLKGLVIDFLKLIGSNNTYEDFLKTLEGEDDLFNQFLNFSTGGRKAVINVTPTIQIKDDSGNLLTYSNPIFNYIKQSIIKFAPYYEPYIDQLPYIRVAVKGVGALIRAEKYKLNTLAEPKNHFKNTGLIGGYTAWDERECLPEMYSPFEGYDLNMQKVEHQVAYTRVPLATIPINGIEYEYKSDQKRIDFLDENNQNEYPLATGNNQLSIVIFAELEGHDVLNIMNYKTFDANQVLKTLIYSPIFLRFLDTFISDKYTKEEIFESIERFKRKEFEDLDLTILLELWTAFILERVFIESQIEVSRFNNRDNRSHQNRSVLIGEFDNDDLKLRKDFIPIDKSFLLDSKFRITIYKKLSSSLININYESFINNLFKRDYANKEDLLYILNSFWGSIPMQIRQYLNYQLVSYIDTNELTKLNLLQFLGLCDDLVFLKPDWFVNHLSNSTYFELFTVDQLSHLLQYVISNKLLDITTIQNLIHKLYGVYFDIEPNLVIVCLNCFIEYYPEEVEWVSDMLYKLLPFKSDLKMLVYKQGQKIIRKLMNAVQSSSDVKVKSVLIALGLYFDYEQ